MKQTEMESELAQLLRDHPIFKGYLTCLVNSYRHYLLMCIDEMRKAGLDTVDMTRNLAKQDQKMDYSGIPRLKTMMDWINAKKGIFSDGENE